MYSFGVFCLIIHNQEQFKVFKNENALKPLQRAQAQCTTASKGVVYSLTFNGSMVVADLTYPGSIHCKLRLQKKVKTLKLKRTVFYQKHA